MSQRILAVAALLLAALVAGLALFWDPAKPTEKEAPVVDFTLQSADGPVAVKDYRGKLVLVYFGYTYCPDICPTALSTAAAGLGQLKPEEAARVSMVFVSVDPERDTPARLKEYATFFHPALVGVTGTADEVAAAARQVGAFYARQKADTAGGYVVDHTSEIYVLGPDGRFVDRIRHGATPEEVVTRIRRHLG